MEFQKGFVTDMANIESHGKYRHISTCIIPLPGLLLDTQYCTNVLIGCIFTTIILRPLIMSGCKPILLQKLHVLHIYRYMYAVKFETCNNYTIILHDEITWLYSCDVQ